LPLLVALRNVGITLPEDTTEANIVDRLCVAVSARNAADKTKAAEERQKKKEQHMQGFGGDVDEAEKNAVTLSEFADLEVREAWESLGGLGVGRSSCD
jgi:hypothetical protein